MLLDRGTWLAALPVRGRKVRRPLAALARVPVAKWEHGRPRVTIWERDGLPDTVLGISILLRLLTMGTVTKGPWGMSERLVLSKQ